MKASLIEAVRALLNENNEENMENLRKAFEDYENNRPEIGADTQAGKLLGIMKEAKSGIVKDRVLELMGISKGNFASLVTKLRKAGIGIVNIGNKWVLEEYVTIGA